MTTQTNLRSLLWGLGFLMLGLFVVQPLSPTGSVAALQPTPVPEPILNPCTGQPFVTLLTNSAISRAQARQGSMGDWGIQVDLAKTEAIEAFAQFTETHKGQIVAITLDGVVQLAPTIQGTIAGAVFISGNFSETEAKQIAAVLSAEPLPATLRFGSVGVSRRGTRLQFVLPESVKPGELGRVMTILERRLNTLDIQDALVFGVGTNHISIDLRGTVGSDEVIQTLVRPGLLEFVDAAIPEGCTAVPVMVGQRIITTASFDYPR